ncbi:hypothetical protein DL96DRAFT_940844 [Flagelloscypha sp. PMI_526]|nr:hypothetical protein DL96DRAFT_940844 [Flagelloscypha sp. PMI_526]
MFNTPHRDANFMQTIFRKHTQESSYQVPELHKESRSPPYQEPNSAPASIDAFHKKKPLMALSNIFGLGLRPSTSRKGSDSSVSSAADSTSQPASDNLPSVPAIPSPRLPPAHSSNGQDPVTRPRSRMSSVSSSKAPSEMAGSKETSATSPSTNGSHSTTSVSSTSRNANLTAPVVSAPLKKRSPSRQSSDVALDRPGSSQSYHRSSAATSTTVTPTLRTIPTRARHSQAVSVASPARDSFASDTSNSTRYRAGGLDRSTSVRKMSVVDEEGRLSEAALAGHEQQGSSSRRRQPRDRETSGNSRANSSTQNIATEHHRHPHTHSQYSSSSKIRSTKHGSFDFERPGWWSSHASAYQPAPIAPELDMRRSVSLREQQDQRTPRESHHSRTASGPNEVGGSLGRHSGRRRGTDGSTSGGKANNGQTEKKKTKRNSLRLGLEAGFAKLKGGFTGHGPFSFEPPVTKPSDSPRASLSHDQDPQSLQNGAPGRRHRPQGSSSGPSAYPAQANFVRPPRPKGRSLDLGIGLSWAPQTLREDRLLPGSHLLPDGRSSPHSTAEEDPANIAEQKIVGEEIAQIFRKALDERGYAAFKEYIRRFDAHELPFDGPKGIIARVERLLSRRAPGLASDGQAQLLGRFVRVVLQNT